MSYLEQFVESMKFNEKFDKEQKKQKYNYSNIAQSIKSNQLDKELDIFLREALPHFASEFIKNSTISFEHQCHGISNQFYENWLSLLPIGESVPPAVTIGNVKYKNKELYQVSKSSIKKIINKGHASNEDLNVHVWLTFPNMMVLDLTIAPTLISKNLATPKDLNECEYVIWEDNFESDFEYIPLLQNNHFLYFVDSYTNEPKT